jgi:hemerythrin
MKYKQQQQQQKIPRINETKSWFFEKINKIDRPLANQLNQKCKRRDNNKHN